MGYLIALYRAYILGVTITLLKEIGGKGDKSRRCCTVHHFLIGPWKVAIQVKCNVDGLVHHSNLWAIDQCKGSFGLADLIFTLQA